MSSGILFPCGYLLFAQINQKLEDKEAQETQSTDISFLGHMTRQRNKEDGYGRTYPHKRMK